MLDFPLVIVYNNGRDARRMTLFPSLDYWGMCAVLVQLLEVTSLVQTGVDGKRARPVHLVLSLAPILLSNEFRDEPH